MPVSVAYAGAEEALVVTMAYVLGRQRYGTPPDAVARDRMTNTLTTEPTVTNGPFLFDEWVNFLMQRRQLLRIKARAEA